MAEPNCCLDKLCARVTTNITSIPLFRKTTEGKNGFLHIARVEKHSERSCFRVHEPTQASTVVIESGSVRCADFQGLSMTHVLQDIHSDTRESVHRCPETCILLVVSVPNPESDMLPPRSKSNRLIPYRARQNCTKWHQHLSNKQIQSHSVGSRNVSHRCTPASDDHFHHCFLVLENVQQSIMVRQFCVRKDASHLSQTWEVPTSCGFWDAAHTVNATHGVSPC